MSKLGNTKINAHVMPMGSVKYICGTDYHHPHPRRSPLKYDSIDKLKDAKECWQECGIAEVLVDGEDGSITLLKWIC